jgi:Protein of unknown function (DUF1580)
MIDLQQKLIPLGSIGKHIPPRRSGARLNPATAWRWAKKGLRGVRLEVVCAGGVPCTTLAALHQFFREVAKAKFPKEAAHAR